jgi:hypothetical protein
MNNIIQEVAQVEWPLLQSLLVDVTVWPVDGGHDISHLDWAGERTEFNVVIKSYWAAGRDCDSHSVSVCNCFPCSQRRGKGRSGHTIKRRPRASNLRNPLPGILSLPNTVDAIKRCMMEVEDRITRAGKGIVLQPTDGEVTGGVEEWLGQGAIELPSVGAFLEAVDVVAAEEKFHVLGAHLVAPEEVDVAGEAARVVLEGVGDAAGEAEGGGGVSVGAGEGAVS